MPVPRVLRRSLKQACPAGQVALAPICEHTISMLRRPPLLAGLAGMRGRKGKGISLERSRSQRPEPGDRVSRASREPFSRVSARSPPDCRYCIYTFLGAIWALAPKGGARLTGRPARYPRIHILLMNFSVVGGASRARDYNNSRKRPRQPFTWHVAQVAAGKGVLMMRRTAGREAVG